MQDEKREGFYKDASGAWQKERRIATRERRGKRPSGDEKDKRNFFRRRADRELYEKDHKEMVKEALEDFAEDHDGRL